MEPQHQRTYKQARVYDVAFSFRNVAAECDALATITQQHGRGPVGAVLELAAGPARHAREFARRGAHATALDAVPAMNHYAQARAQADGVALETVCADMSAFRLSARFDLAVLLMDSASYLLDNDTVLRHLACVAGHLVDGGLYVLEMGHPRDAFGVGTRSTQSHWTAEDQGLRVSTRWGHDDDTFDPITQIDAVRVHLQWSGPEGADELTETARQRRFTANEFDALVRASGCFETVACYGALDVSVPFDNAPAAWRMVPVLRKRASRA
ncbi:MAG: class I SAM-dependent methyltransferase [Rubrivivax sp.]|nr:class I SAM-dependent methyltransferase [Rubrivivax sp.]